MNNDNNKEKNFIFQSWVNLKFLEFYRCQIDNNSDITLKQFEKNWREKINSIEFQIPNKASFNSNLYPLLIYPKEAFFDSIPDIAIDEINKKFNIQIEINVNNKVSNLQQLLRRMRNSIVHNRMKECDEWYIFHDSNNKEKIEFKMKISFQDLADLITSLMNYIIFDIKMI